MFFSAYPYCKGHTWAMVSMKSGSIMDPSRNQKINGRISTEAKIVVADDALPQCLWLRYFIVGLGYAVEEIKFHQDNMSAMLIENNFVKIQSRSR